MIGSAEEIVGALGGGVNEGKDTASSMISMAA